MPNRDPIKRLEYIRAWRAKNPDKVQAGSLRGRDRQREYRRENLARYAEYQRKRRLTHPRETLVEQAKSRAKKGGLPFNISVATIDWSTHCPVLGIELDYHCMHAGNRKIQPNSPTLDRRVNNFGYIQGNVFVLSHQANRLKQDATIEQLEALLRYMRSTP